MKRENSSINFNNQQFFIGIDVHKRNWTVTIRTNNLVVSTFSMNPSTEQLVKHLRNHYPGGEYLSVYEAGYSGYWIHRELERAGIRNIIAAPTEIPTSYNEKTKKSDPVDSRKLARELENGSLSGIYIPDKLQQEMRSLMRLRFQLVKAQTKLKNQIKGYLNFYGHQLPANYEMRHWSRQFIEKLKVLEFEYEIGQEQLRVMLEELVDKRDRIVRVIKTVQRFIKEYKLEDTVCLLCSIPGIGYTTAVTIVTEIMNLERFTNFDQLASYCGLVPSIRSSSDKEIVLGIKQNHNVKIRLLLVESAWMAVRKDPVLMKAYDTLKKRMSKQEAIIRIAKKILSRVNFVWRNGKLYEKVKPGN